jgi:ribose/xylose/arabinose/galactoside ABC-type transport system permease subunit
MREQARRIMTDWGFEVNAHAPLRRPHRRAAPGRRDHPGLAVLIIVGALLNSHFLTVWNITGIGQQISALGVVAVVVGESLILLIGGMDLSLEAAYGLAPMVAAWLLVPVAASGVLLPGVVQNILDLENAPNYWVDAIDGTVILVALTLARVIGGEASAE